MLRCDMENIFYQSRPQGHLAHRNILGNVCAVVLRSCLPHHIHLSPPFSPQLTDRDQAGRTGHDCSRRPIDAANRGAASNELSSASSEDNVSRKDSGIGGHKHRLKEKKIYHAQIAQARELPDIAASKEGDMGFNSVRLRSPRNFSPGFPRLFILPYLQNVAPRGIDRIGSDGKINASILRPRTCNHSSKSGNIRIATSTSFACEEPTMMITLFSLGCCRDRLDRTTYCSRWGGMWCAQSKSVL